MKRISSGQLINYLQVFIAASAYGAYRHPDAWWSWMPPSWIIGSMILTSIVTVAFARASTWDGSMSQLIFSTVELVAYQSLIFLVTYSPTYLPNWFFVGYPWVFTATVVIANGGQVFYWLASKTTPRQISSSNPMMG